MTHRAKCAMLFKELSGSTHRQEVAEYATKIPPPIEESDPKALTVCKKKKGKTKKIQKSY